MQLSRRTLMFWPPYAMLPRRKAQTGRRDMHDTYARELHACQLMGAEDYDAAIAVLEPLAEEGSEYAHMSLGWIHEGVENRKPDWSKAQFHYERAIACGSVVAYAELGRLLDRRGLEAEARTILEAGAALGNLPCMARLGAMLTKGRGGNVEFGTGIMWLQTAAAQGHFFAQRQLLGLELKSARSLASKLGLWRRIFLLANQLFIESLKDPWSDKTR